MPGKLPAMAMATSSKRGPIEILRREQLQGRRITAARTRRERFGTCASRDRQTPSNVALLTVDSVGVPDAVQRDAQRRRAYAACASLTALLLALPGLQRTTLGSALRAPRGCCVAPGTHTNQALESHNTSSPAASPQPAASPWTC